jgi:magnesium-transporting ATPase (P-type)
VDGGRNARVLAFAQFSLSVLALVLYEVIGGEAELSRLLFQLVPPLTAALAIIPLVRVLPDLIPPGELRFPLNLTMPIVHNILILVSVALAATRRAVILHPPEPIEWIAVWARAELLGLNILLHTGVLTLAMLVIARRSR